MARLKDEKILDIAGLQLNEDRYVFLQRMHSLLDAQIAEDVKAKLSATTDEQMELTPDEKKTIMLKYSLDICQSNPIKEFNSTELQDILIQAQLAKSAPIHALQIRDAVSKEQERIITMIENDYPEEAQSIRKALKEKGG